MAKNKKSVLVYIDWITMFEKLSDEEAGKLIKHFFRYVNDMNPETPDRMTELLFEPMKATLKRDLLKWSDVRLMRSESGKLGGLKSGEARRSKTKQNEANASNLKQNEANEAVSVSVSVSDSVKEKKKDIMPEKEFPATYYELVEKFHSFKSENFPELMKGVRKNIKGGMIAIDRLINIDGFTFNDIRDILNWSIKNDFWNKQILSLSSLRNKGKNGETKFVNCRTAYLRDRKEPAQQQKISRDPTVPEAIWGHYNAEQLEEYHKKLNEYFGKTNK